MVAVRQRGREEDQVPRPHCIGFAANVDLQFPLDEIAKFLANVLHPAFPDLRVTIEDQVAEGDKVVTRKTITGTHSGALMGIAPTGRAVSISVIDIVRIEDGRYAEHWGVNTLPAVLVQLRG